MQIYFWVVAGASLVLLFWGCFRLGYSWGWKACLWTMVMQKRIEKIEEEKRETQTKESRSHKEEPVLFGYRGENWFGTGDEDPPF